MSVSLEVTETGLSEALLRIEGIADAPRAELMEGIGRLVQEQTRRRIEEEKTSPAGARWKANRAGTPTLHQSGALSRSVDYIAGEDSVQVGSGLVYVEATLDANPGLAGLGVILPRGTVVRLPEFVVGNDGAAVRRLWDEG